MLPEISHENDSCIECEFWQITDPNFKCQDCRVPEIIELMSLSGGTSKNKALPRLDIPLQIQAARLNTSENAASMPSEPLSFRKVGQASRCSACELSALVDPSTTTSCQSCAFGPSYLSPLSTQSPKCEVRRSRAGRNSKLPLSALNRLQAWLDANHHDPYPSAETKRSLAQECGITEKQVTTWFTNARARQLSPLDTYLSSSSDEEGARQSDIEDAAETSIHTAGFSYLPETRVRGQDRRAASISDASIFSNPQTQVRPSRRGKKKDYRRNANPETPQTPMLLSPSSITSPLDVSPPDDPDMWQCTFCRKSLVPKSWRRHEETQHRPKAQWTCMLYGPRLNFPARSNSSSVCAFCMMKNPSEEHFLSHHRIEDCAKRDVVDRTFFRPDHLRQHVKNFHNASLFDIVQARWKKAAETVPEGWTCGFCGERLETWDKRESHIANHFKDGMTMASWSEYPENVSKAEKKSKTSEKSKGHGSFSALNRLSRHAFPRRSTRSSQSQNQAQSFQQQPDIEPSQTSFANAWDPITSSLGLGITQPQAPVLPDLPPLDPLMDCGGFGDWNLPATADPGMQYALTSSGIFDLPTSTLAQQFDGTLAMDIYGGSMGFQQGGWAQMETQHQQHQHANTHQSHHLHQNPNQHQHQHHHQQQ